MKPLPNGLILFDGSCNLCSRTMAFVVRNNPSDSLRFCSMQSPQGQAFLQQLDMPTSTYTSMLLFDESNVFEKSDAVLQIANHLRWPWRCLGWASCVPKPMRDLLYTVVARHRYKLFGRRDACAVFDTALERRFLRDE